LTTITERNGNLMKFKRYIAIFLTVLFCLSTCACGESESTKTSDKKANNQKKIKDSITLIYSEADGFNPYNMQTETNRHLSKLIFEPLVKLDNEFNAVFSLAENVEVEGTVCKVLLKKAEFSDSSTVTAEDVVYSFNLAKSSATTYSARLYNVVSASAQNPTTVIFTLSKFDRYCANILTFPIIKKESENIADADGILKPPIGAGRFKVNDSNDGLEINENFKNYKGKIKKVKLINAPDLESITHYAQIGAPDLYFSDVTNGSITRMSGKKYEINLNSMVYIGINQNYGALSQNLLRQAISTAINRKSICQKAYYNNALPATGFFTPVFKDTKSVQNIQNEANSKITIENLEKIGYNSLDGDGIRVNSNATPLEFTLLVNQENSIRVSAAKLIKDQLANFGIEITVVEKTYEQYLTDLANGNFQLFVGEVKLTENMDISCLVKDGGSAAFGLLKTDAPQEGVETPKKVSDVVDGFYQNENSITDVATVLQGEMPFVPICYRTATLFYNDKIENVNSASESDIYFSIDSYIYYNQQED